MKKITLLSICLLLLFSPDKSVAQGFKKIFPKFYKNGDELISALSGGLNNPQFSKMDINRDGLSDIIIFDRSGNVWIPYIAKSGNEGIYYQYDASYEDLFPSVAGWALLRDYDGDGIEDVFAFSIVQGISGISVFKGGIKDGKINFQEIQFKKFIFNVLPLETGTSYVNLYASQYDIPAFDDIDGDGDLDILAFGISGTNVIYFQNQSRERGFGKDSLQFITKDDCWGRFTESYSSSKFILSPNCVDCPGGFDGLKIVSPRHSGSTMLTFDENNTGAKSLIIGSIDGNKLKILRNTGTAAVACITSWDTSYPQANQILEIQSFPSSFLLDVNGDNHKDIIASCNAEGSEDYDVVHYYRNKSTDATYQFEYIQNDYLMKDMIDMGSGSAPAVTDINGDGLPDIILGGYGKYIPKSAKRIAKLLLFLNTGTANDPKFELADTNYLNLRQYSGEEAFESLSSYVPTFWDIDGNGTLDLIIGAQGETGLLIFFRNKALPGQPVNFDPPQLYWQNLNLGTFPSPAFADLDDDGLDDLIVGKYTGYISFYKNRGTKTNPVFDNTPDLDRLGNIKTLESGFFTGNAAPIVFKWNGKWKILCGSENGKLYMYGNIEDRLTEDFDVVSGDWGNIRSGYTTKPYLADINNDNILDMVIGNYSGGIRIYETDLNLQIGTNDLGTERFKIFPNPATTRINIELYDRLNGKTVVEIYDMSGKRMIRNAGFDYSMSFDISSLLPGMYIVKVQNYAGTTRQKFIKTE